MLYSCAPKKAGVVPVKLKIFQSNLLTGVPINGGVLIAGKSEDGLESFRFGLANANQDVTLDLKKGKWEFAAIAWSGENGLLTGVSRCSATGMIELKDNDATVNLNLTQSRCLSTFSSSNRSFTSASSQELSGRFYSLKPVLCVNGSLNSTACPVSSNSTIFKSYRVLFPSDIKGNIGGSLSSLVSACRLVSDNNHATLPLGSSADTTPFGFKFELYPSANCTGTVNSLDFSSGVLNAVASNSSMALENNSSALTTYLFFNPGASYIALNNVQINSGASATNSINANVSFNTLLPGVTNICFTEVNSAGSCSWISDLNSPQAFSLSAGDGTKTIYLFSKTDLGATELIGQDSIVLDTTAPASGSIGSYADAYNASSFPLNLNWGTYNDNATISYSVSHCQAADCTTGCTNLASAHPTNSYSLTSLPADGSYFICVSASDTVGNISSKSNVGSFEYDTVAPGTTILNLNSSATYSSSLTLNYNLSSTGANFICLNESTSETGCAWSAYSASGSYTISGEGNKTVYAHFKDNAGNTSLASDSIIIDTSAPTAPGSASISSYINASGLPVAISWGASVDVHLDHYDYKFCQNSDCTTACGSVSSTVGTAASATINSTDVNEGINHICARGVDTAVNSSSYALIASFTYDTTAPVASSFSLEAGNSYTNTLSINWSAGAATGSPNQMCVTDSASSTGCAWVSVASSGSHTLPAGDGTKNVYLFFRDLANNVSSSISDAIILDTTSPTSVAISSPSSAIETESKSVQVTFSGGTDANFDKYFVKLCNNSACSGTIYESLELPSGTTNATLTATNGWALNTNAYVLVKAKDLAGNYSAIAASQPINRVIYARVKDVQSEYNHSCALLSNGKVKCWGVNAAGQLGNGTAGPPIGDSLSLMGDNLLPVDLGIGFDAAQIDLGVYFSCALSTAGAIKCWGNNVYGTLGQGNTAGSNFPVSVDVGPDLPIQISAGANHVCIVTENGNVKCWGGNNFGQLGIGNVLTKGDNASEMGNNLVSVDLGINSKAVKVVAGSDFSCALLSNRQVKCWGKNDSGQLGQNNQNNVGDGTSAIGPMGTVHLGTGQGVLDIVAGNNHACALLVSGDVKCWGDNSHGQLGTGDTVDRGDGAISMTALTPINFSGLKVIQVAAGQDTTCAVLENGTARCWGWNTYGISGLGNTTDILEPLSNTINLGTGLLVKKISISLESACATLSNGRVKCWGQNANGRLGIGTTQSMGDNSSEMGDILPYVSLGTSTSFGVEKIASGANHNCALMYNGLVKCWGSNDSGQIGLNQTNGQRGATAGDMGENLSFLNLGGAKFVRDIISGGYQSNSNCAIMSDGEMRCWGDNSQGQLGIGDNVSSNLKIGDESDEVSTTFLDPVTFGGQKVRSAAMGPGHTCAIAVNGSVYCFGQNNNGQLGLGNTTPTLAPSSAVDLLIDKAIQLAIGSTHTCALLSSGELKCWGSNGSGELGQNNTANIGETAASMSSLSQVFVGSGLKILKVSAGWSSTCALLDSHNVKCWGYNGNGVLGLNIDDNVGTGTTSISSTPVVNFDTSATNSLATDIQTNGNTSCILKASGIVRCWGDNTDGMLGQNRAVPNIGTSTSFISSIINSILGPIVSTEKISLGMNGCAISGIGDALCWGSNQFGKAGQETSTSHYGTDISTVPATDINL